MVTECRMPWNAAKHRGPKVHVSEVAIPHRVIDRSNTITVEIVTKSKNKAWQHGCIRHMHHCSTRVSLVKGLFSVLMLVFVFMVPP
jgi:hypothetical protein